MIYRRNLHNVERDKKMLKITILVGHYCTREDVADVVLARRSADQCMEIQRLLNLH